MGEVTYTTVPGKIKPLLSKIHEVGIPQKATVQWLKSIGFKSSNDASLLGILKLIGLVDGSGVPTPRWSRFRGTDHRKVLGEAIREGYADLFAVYSDASQRRASELEHVFSTSSSAGKQVISKAVSTFKNLCEDAEFSPISDQTELQIKTGPIHTPLASSAVGKGAVTTSQMTPSLHIDIQLHISPEASAEQIDQIFKSMARHLYGAKESE